MPVLTCSTAGSDLRQQSLADAVCYVTNPPEEVSRVKKFPGEEAESKAVCFGRQSAKVPHCPCCTAPFISRCTCRRYIGAYTDGGAALRQHGFDNLCAPIPFYQFSWKSCFISFKATQFDPV